LNWVALFSSMCGCLCECCRLVGVLRSSLRGLFGRSFLGATVPQPVPSWTPADRELRPRSDAIAPDTDKIDSIVLRDSSPLHNQEYAWPKDQVQGTHRAGEKPQGFARRSGESTPSHGRRSISPVVLMGATLQLPGRRTGQRWEPTRAPRQGSKRNEGGPERFTLVLCPRAAIPL
jgi:hypothetical protein